MGTIGTSDFLVETKRAAAVYEVLDAAYGSGSETGTASKGAANALTAITALSDEEVLVGLLPGAIRLAEAAKISSYYSAAFQQWLWDMDQHVGGINDYLEDNDLHIHYYCKAIYSKITAKNVFPPVTDFGTFLLSGSGAGAWTAQDSVDTDLYGDGLVELVTESVIGAADVEVTVLGTDFDGDVAQVTATITAATGNDATVAVNETTIRLAAVTSVSVTGGTTADAFRVQTKVDRSPTGIA